MTREKHTARKDAYKCAYFGMHVRQACPTGQDLLLASKLPATTTLPAIKNIFNEFSGYEISRISRDEDGVETPVQFTFNNFRVAV